MTSYENWPARARCEREVSANDSCRGKTSKEMLNAEGRTGITPSKRTTGLCRNFSKRTLCRCSRSKSTDFAISAFWLESMWKSPNRWPTWKPKRAREKKLLRLIEEEKEREAALLVARLRSEKELDLEAIEFFVRATMLKAGAQVLEAFLEMAFADEEAPVCAENHTPKKMQSTGKREKQIHSILGSSQLRRTRFVCPVCGNVRYPGDEALGVVGTGFSPGARRMMARAGAKESFGEAAEDLQVFAALKVDAKDVERVAEKTGRVVGDWMAEEATNARLVPPVEEKIETLYVSFDGTGVPMRPDELANVRGKAPDGKAKTREVKLGCVFTQTGVDNEGRPVRDEGSTTYVGAIEKSVEFGHRIHGEAMRRGMAGAQRVVVITDGAAYNKSIIDAHFPDATRILDLYHAREHLAEFAKDTIRIPLADSFHIECRALLDRGDVPALIDRMKTKLPRSGARRKEGLKQIEYFRRNAAAMRYGEFRAMGLFVGSGVVEAGCRAVIGQRLKRSGMFWSVVGANAIIALRCCLASGRFEQFWEDAA